MRGDASTLLPALLATACASAGGVPAPAGGRADERLLLTSFGELAAVAVGPRHAFAAGPGGIIAWDFAFQRWEPPLTDAGPFPAHERISALEYDRGADQLWLGTESGSLWTVTPGFGRWDRVPGAGIAPILEIVHSPRAGAVFLATATGWLRVRSGALVPERIAAADVPAIVRERVERAIERRDPFFDAARATIGLDPALRRWPLADVEPGERTGEYWIATRGGGLLHWDSRFQRAQWLPFGTLSRGAGAIALDADRIWFGGDGRGPRDGVAMADRALERWAHFDARDGAPAGAVARIAAGQRAVWFAAAGGLYRLDRATAQRGGAAGWARFTARDGLPADAATAVAAAGSGAWVGTPRGLILVAEDGRPASAVLLPGVRVHGLALVRDTLWVASGRGLHIIATTRAIPPTGAGGANATAVAIETAPGTDAVPALRASVQDVAAAEDVYATTADGLYRWHDGAWAGPERGTSIARLGRLTVLAAEPGAVWLGGEHGAARQDRGTGIWTYLLAGTHLPPGPVRAIAPAGDRVWIATAAGALRLDWRRQ